ncbi:MAG: ancA 5, partial [Verrucomicrobiales bacterium]|nr:ancA 5 [Verrucomicrobiales bacterium]
MKLPFHPPLLHYKTRPGPAHALRGPRAGAARRLVPVLLGCCCFGLAGIIPPLGAQTLKVWNSTVPLPAEPGEVVDAALGGGHMLVVRRDGTVTGSGTNRIGISEVPVSTITAGMSGVVAVAAGAGHSLALKSDGTVAAWGFDSEGQSTVPQGLTGVVAIAAGQMHSLALRDDGTVAAWGYECTVPAGLSGVVAIAAEGHYSLALKSDGTLVSWGQTYNRELNPAGVMAAAAGAQHSLALKTDGTVTAWGGNFYGECQVPAGLAGVVELAAGTYYSLALKSDRTLAVWGNAGDIPAAGVPEVAAVSAGINGALALLGTPGRPPAILGSMRALATGGYGSFRYRIATASPAVSFAAAGLPPGLA